MTEFFKKVTFAYILVIVLFIMALCIYEWFGFSRLNRNYNYDNVSNEIIADTYNEPTKRYAPDSITIPLDTIK